MIHAMYILTDSAGFTTCCEPTTHHMMTEAGRRPLLAPITVVHWQIQKYETRRRTEHLQWRCLSTRTWDGSAIPWH